MATRFLPLPSLLLSVLLAAPFASAWALPTFSAPPPPYHGEKCQAADPQAQPAQQDKHVSFESIQSPCRLEDAEVQKSMRLNAGQTDTAEILHKVEEWDVLNRHTPGQETSPGLQSLHGGPLPPGATVRSGATGMSMAPVPEPATYAMLLGGLGLIALRRRRKARPAARR